MSVIAYIIVALALGLGQMLFFRRCAEVAPVRLSVGMLTAFSAAVVQALLMLLGLFAGLWLRVKGGVEAVDLRTNTLVFLGVEVFLALKMLLPYLKREQQLPAFDLRSLPTAAASTVASGINALIAGLGAGFIATVPSHIHRALWPMLIVGTLLGTLGIMYGRRKVKIRPRRWMILAALLLAGTAAATTVIQLNSVAL